MLDALPIEVLAFALFALAMAGAAPAVLPNLNLADVPEEDLSAGWSRPGALGPIRCRRAAPGKMRTFRLRAWWPSRSLRPPEGAIYAIEIRYKDTATRPVVFSAFGNLGKDPVPTELHRFGGHGDGKWKTAVVPVGWDQLIRLPDEPGKIVLAAEANAEVPIATVRFRRATRADERRYNAETRQWVARVQKRRGAQAPLNIQPRKFLPGQELGPVVAFSWPAVKTLMPDDQPTDGQVGAPVRFRMCLNEMDGGAFGVYANDADLTDVSYSCSPLTGPGGKLQADVIGRTVEYAVDAGGKKDRAYRWKAQRFWPAYAVDIPAGRSHWFLLNIRTRRGRTVAGTYTGRITITARQGRAVLPVEVEVLPIDLPTMNEAGLFMGGCVRGLVPVHDFDFALDYNQNGTNVFFFGVKPGMRIADGKLELDFTYLDEWMLAARKRGLKGVVWFLGGDPYKFPNTMTLFRDLARLDTRDGNRPLGITAWMNRQGSPARRNGPMTAERELAVEWVRQVTTHARRAGWPELILTPFDEPAKWLDKPGRKTSTEEGILGAGPWIKPYFKDACAVIREGAPSNRIYASIHRNRTAKQEGITFLPDVDVFCTNAIHEDPALGDKVRRAGKDFWQYTGQGRGSRIEHSRYTFGFFFAAFGSRGSLCWAYNWGRGFDTSEGVSWMYAWQTPFDTIPGPYYEGLREAWDDRRLIEAYRKKFAGDREALGLLEGILAEAVRSRAAGGRDTVNDFYAAMDDATKLQQWRDALLDRMTAPE